MKWAGIVAAVVLATLAGLAGCSTSGSGGSRGSSGATSVTHALPHETAQQALLRQLRELSDGQYGRLYDELHPAQQALVTKAKFNSCYRAQGFGNLPTPRIISADADRIAIGGTNIETDATAITIKAGTQTLTFDEVRLGSRWVFTVDHRVIDAANAEAC